VLIVDHEKIKPVAKTPQITLGGAVYHCPDDLVKGEHTTIEGEPYLCIRNVDALDPFLMSIVSNGDQWLFVGSNSVFTAGRVDPDRALFPYQTADKLLRNPQTSGAMSIFLVSHRDTLALWEPWQPSGRAYKLARNLYKHAYGTGVIFEEINYDLGLRLRWSLTTSETFGLVRECSLENLTDRSIPIRYLDGWHQLMPPGITQETFSRYSYLASAYMHHECLPEIGLGIYTLNTGITDRAEPSESLRVSCAWSLGHSNPVILLSDRQIEAFRRGSAITGDHKLRGEFGAYLVADSIDLAAEKKHTWFNVADIALDHSALGSLKKKLGDPDALRLALVEDVEANASGLKKRIAAADGLQDTADRSTSLHHFANVLFNCMRGGTLNDSCYFSREDFTAFLKSRNTDIHDRHITWIEELPERLKLDELLNELPILDDPQLARLAHEYLPLSFSRRHGDPSRPWNRFAIHLKDGNDQPVYGYQGNWRDIFQNWEGLAQSHPAYLGAMISVFLNASTADGYNPYRITRKGIEWEVLDPKDPWSHIGYWGDHQIIYLLRLLESHERFQPGGLAGELGKRFYAYARVPYEIGTFHELVRNPHNSIKFDEDLHSRLMTRAGEIGGDGKLLCDRDGNVALVTLAEKLLVPLLVKLSNLVPGGGIWMNTQRPEWNDANNALAGFGLSMVTVYYTRRYLQFLQGLFAGREEALELSQPVATLLQKITGILENTTTDGIDDARRFEYVAALGRAGAAHRKAVYNLQLETTSSLPAAVVRKFISTALNVIDATIHANRRADGMYHSYNLLGFHGQQASVRHLHLMLEGQVAVLSSGVLAPAGVLELLRALRTSDLYRADQHSYLLYPDREIHPFLSRNTFSGESLRKSSLLADLVDAGDRSLVMVDEDGRAHFHADLTNTADLNHQLDLLAADPRWKETVAENRGTVLELWEKVFQHSTFTGRSGTMFGFEGLGSIYWHMIAKLLLAVQENHHWAVQSGADAGLVEALRESYYDIRHGLGFTKTPEIYGAFPTDPYSHSPRHRGAQQPGMTGQVKEEILTRLGELGVEVEEGCLRFAPGLLHPGEFFNDSKDFSYVDIHNCERVWKLPPQSLAFTYCQVPVCYSLADAASITIENASGGGGKTDGNLLTPADSLAIFSRTGEISRLLVAIPRNTLHS